MPVKRLTPIHPGEILFEDFMKPLGLSINGLSRDLDTPPNRIHAIVRGRRSITADTALRLAAYFGNSAQTWMNLQVNYDLRVAERQSAAEIARRVRRPAA